MKPPLFVTTLIFLLFAVAAHAGEKGTKTFQEWTALISKDAKVESLQSILGKPDIKRTDGQSLYYIWTEKIDIGTTLPAQLEVIAMPYQNQLIIVAISDPRMVESPLKYFPWAQKIIDSFEK